MPEKEYRIEFLQGYIQSDDDTRRVSHVIREVIEAECPSSKVYGYDYRLREASIAGGGRSFKGVLAKFRTDYLPHIGAPQGEEREIELADDEGIIEKNYFLYYARRQILVYQTNAHGSRPSTLGKYLTNFANETVTFSPLIQPEALRRLVARNGRPRSIEVSYARPSDEIVAQNTPRFNKNLVELLSGTGGQRAHIKITPPRNGYLDINVGQVFRRLLDDLDVRLAKVSVEEDGVEHTVDLIADRLVGHRSVRMTGPYPVPEDMFNALRACYDDNRATIDGLVNDPGNEQGH